MTLSSGPLCPRCRTAGPEQRGDTHYRCPSCRLIFDGNTLARRAPSKATETAATEIAATSVTSVRAVGWMLEGARAVPHCVELLDAGEPSKVLRAFPGVERELILRWRNTGGWVWLLAGRTATWAFSPLGVAGTIAISLDRMGAATTIFLVGLVMSLYALIAAYVNGTSIRISSKGLRVEHGPMPWPGHHRFTSSEIAQLYCEVVIPSSEGRDPAYRVMVILASGKQVALMPDLVDPSVALFVEEAVERTLGIQDQVVGGENVLK